MKEKLKKIKETLEKSTTAGNNRDILLGQAIGMLDSLISDIERGVTTENLPIPDMIWKHVEKPTNQTMMDAVQRHKQIHTELSKDSVTQKNTQFEQLK
jgi:hypothetical protein